MNVLGGYYAICSNGQILDKTILNEIQRAVSEAHNQRSHIITPIDLGAGGVLFVEASYSANRVDESGRGGVITAAAILQKSRISPDPDSDLSELFKTLVKLRDDLVDQRVPREISRLAIIGVLASFNSALENLLGQTVKTEAEPLKISRASSILRILRYSSPVIQLATLGCSLCILFFVLLLSFSSIPKTSTQTLSGLSQSVPLQPTYSKNVGSTSPRNH